MDTLKSCLKELGAPLVPPIEPFALGENGGASKNRTYDLVIISDAL